MTPVFGNVAPRVILHKFRADSDIYALLHHYYAWTNGTKTWEAGFDISDQDISNEAFMRYINSLNNPDIIPYTNWFGPNIIDISAITAAPSAKPTGAEADYVANKAGDKANNPLSWKNLFSYEQYNNDMRAILSDYRDRIKTALLVALRGGKDSLVSTDITNVLQDYTHDTTTEQLNNQLTLEITTDPQGIGTYSNDTYVPITSASMSHAEFNAGVGGTVTASGRAALPVIEENDIIELRVMYLSSNLPDKPVYKEGMFIDSDGYERVFIGPVSQVIKNQQYGRCERATVICGGISKTMALSRSAYVPSLQSNADTFAVQGVELTQPGVTFFHNIFAAKTAGDMFKALAKPTLLYTSEESPSDTSSSLISSASQAAPTATSTFSAYTQPYSTRIQALGLTSESSTKQRISDFKGIGELDLVFLKADAIKAAQELESTATALFQFMSHIPALHVLAREQNESKYKDLSDILATVEMGKSPAMQLLLAKSISLYYPDMRTPEEILNNIKATTYLEIYEDRPGVVRMRPPKYNIINMNPEPVLDFKSTAPDDTDAAASRNVEDDTVAVYRKDKDPILLNKRFTIDPEEILDYTIIRHDEALQTRSDHELMMPIAGAPMSGYSIGHYTDPCGLVRYGLRTAGIVQNPMSQSPEMGGVLSAVHLAALNKNTRSVSVTVRNQREFRLGQLYFIPVIAKDVPTQTQSKPMDPAVQNDLTAALNKGLSLQTASDACSGASTRAAESVSVAVAPLLQGVVGYLTRVVTSAGYGRPPAHQLTLNYIRVADLLETAAGVKLLNYKRLPDIQTALEMMCATTEAVKVREKINKAANLSTGTDKPGSNSSAALISGSAKGYLTLDNASAVATNVYNDATMQAIVAAGVTETAAKRVKELTWQQVARERGTFATPLSATLANQLTGMAVAGVTLAYLDPGNYYCAAKGRDRKWSQPGYRLTRSYETRNINALLRVLGDMCLQFLVDSTPFGGVNTSTLTWDVNAASEVTGTSVSGHVGESNFTFRCAGSSNDPTGKHIIVGNISVARPGYGIIKRGIVLPVPDSNTADIANILNTGFLRRVNNCIVASTFATEVMTLSEITDTAIEIAMEPDGTTHDPTGVELDYYTAAGDDMYFRAVSLLDAYYQPGAVSAYAGKNIQSVSRPSSTPTDRPNMSAMSLIASSFYNTSAHTDWPDVLTSRDSTFAELKLVLKALGISPAGNLRIAQTSWTDAGVANAALLAKFSFVEYLRQSTTGMADVFIYTPYLEGQRPYAAGLDIHVQQVSVTGGTNQGTKQLFDIKYCDRGDSSGGFVPIWTDSKYAAINSEGIGTAGHVELGFPDAIILEAQADPNKALKLSKGFTFIREHCKGGAQADKPLNIFAFADGMDDVRRIAVPLSHVWYIHVSRNKLYSRSFKADQDVANRLNLAVMEAERPY